MYVLPVLGRPAAKLLNDKRMSLIIIFKYVLFEKEVIFIKSWELPSTTNTT